MPILARAGAAAAKGFGMLGKIAAAVDEYFEYVTLLLHGNGTNGAQNNTFLDSSTNNFTITRNGNTTQGTFTPYGSNWSNYFDGSDDLNAPSNAAFTYGTSDFTIEGWFFITGRSGPNSYEYLFAQGSSTGTSSLGLYREGGVLKVWNGSAVITGTTTLALNTWNHIALSRSGTTMRLFLNGVQEGSATNSNSISTGSTYGISVGRWTEVDTNYIVGYVSNFRVVKGTAVYASAFTPSTAPLTAITNTSLLTCQSNRFIDNSANNFTITRNGDVSVQRFSPFNPTTPYAAGTIGGSGYFDGTGDYLVISSGNVAQFGTGDFTMEAWVYLLSHDGDESALMTGGINFSTYTQPNVNIATNGTVNLNGTQSTSNTVPLNTWTHIAVSRNSGTSRIFINGVQGSSASNTSNYNGVGAMIGLRSNGSSDFGSIHAYISNVRYVNGTGLYTSAFTPNTAPLSAVSGTSLLLNFTNGGIIDNAMMNDLETVGNAQISTSVSKFGGGSLAFDGAGDYLYEPATQLLAWGTGNFTLEMWVNTSTTSVSGGASRTMWGTSSASYQGQMYLEVGTGKVVFGNTGSTFLKGSSNVADGTWHHIAVSRSGTTCRLFIDGTQEASGTNSVNYDAQAIYIGAFGPSDGYFNGYIDDLRITKGYARYTANFTPPTAPFPDQ